MIAKKILFQVVAQEIIGGHVLKKDFYSLTTDTRQHQKGWGFIALTGVRFDATDFIASVLENTCPFVVYPFKNKNKISHLFSQYSETCFIGVEDTLVFLQELARLKIEEFQAQKNKVVAITGSNGKTTTKELLAFLLAQSGASFYYTQKNFNNHIGVPLTILEMPREARILVLEMGTSSPGEIAFLANLVRPSIGLITNIGHAHLEKLKDRRGVFQEKTALFKVVERDKGVCILNRDDDFLKTYPSQNAHHICVSTEDPSSSFYLDIQKKKLNCRGEEISLEGFSGALPHEWLNLAMVAAAASEVIDFNTLKASFSRLDAFSSPHNRGSWKRQGETFIYLDAYNANPDSMNAALCLFEYKVREREIDKKECLLIVGDMNELGEQASDFHYNLAKKIQEMAFNNVIYIGKYAQVFKKGYGAVKIFTSREHFTKEASFDPKNYKAIFIKASRSLELDRLI